MFQVGIGPKNKMSATAELTGKILGSQRASRAQIHSKRRGVVENNASRSKRVSVENEGFFYTEGETEFGSHLAGRQGISEIVAFDRCDRGSFGIAGAGAMVIYDCEITS